MISNFADLPPWICWQISWSSCWVQIWSDLPQIWQIYPLVGWHLPCGTWHLVVKMISNLADLPLDPGRSTPVVLTSCGQDDFKFCRSTPRSAGRSTPWYWHLVVKMSSNLADLPLDLLTDPPSQYWHLVVKMISNLADLPPGTDIWQVKMSSNMADLPLDLLADLPPCTDISWSRWVQIWQFYP